MPYTMEDFQREIKEEFLGSITEKDLDQLLEKFKPKDVLKKIKREEIEEYLKNLKEGAER